MTFFTAPLAGFSWPPTPWVGHRNDRASALPDASTALSSTAHPTLAGRASVARPLPVPSAAERGTGPTTGLTFGHKGKVLPLFQSGPFLGRSDRLHARSIDTPKPTQFGEADIDSPSILYWVVTL